MAKGGGGGAMKQRFAARTLLEKMGYCRGIRLGGWWGQVGRTLQGVRKPLFVGARVRVCVRAGACVSVFVCVRAIILPNATLRMSQ